MLGFFDRPDPATTAKLLSAIAADGPGVTREQAAAIKVPTLVIGNGLDLVHPMDLARSLASAIAGAQFVEIAPKSLDKAVHAQEFKAAVNKFLTQKELTHDRPPRRRLVRKPSPPTASSSKCRSGPPISRASNPTCCA